MADLMAGPNAPLTKAFISCGWRCLTVDWLLDASHDLADERRQQSLSSQLEEAIFIAAAIDCSTKSRAREIPRKFEDGRPAPGPLRSEVYPDGLPHLTGRDAQRSTWTTKHATTCSTRSRSCVTAVVAVCGKIRLDPCTGGHRLRWPCGSQASGWTHHMRPVP